MGPLQWEWACSSSQSADCSSRDGGSLGIARLCYLILVDILIAPPVAAAGLFRLFAFDSGALLYIQSLSTQTICRWYLSEGSLEGHTLKSATV